MDPSEVIEEYTPAQFDFLFELMQKSEAEKDIKLLKLIHCQKPQDIENALNKIISGFGPNDTNKVQDSHEDIKFKLNNLKFKG